MSRRKFYKSCINIFRERNLNWDVMVRERVENNREFLEIEIMIDEIKILMEGL